MQSKLFNMATIPIESAAMGMPNKTMPQMCVLRFIRVSSFTAPS